MFRVPEYYPHVSRILSEVMGDIGLNESTVNVRRRTVLLMESTMTLTDKVLGKDFTTYHFGSQSEGTTTLGLNSDIDELMCHNNVNVIKRWDEWVQGKMNLLMIQDDTTSPGYCRLQLLRGDIPVACDDIPEQCFEYDEQRRVLMKNNCFLSDMPDTSVRNGPAQTDEENNSDHVKAFPIRTRPGQAIPGIVRRYIRHDHSRHVLQNALYDGCFIVGTGHTNSNTEYLEWRISTSMAERFMMFNMNITQLRCYTILKIITKSFIAPEFPKTISSFHCKTALMNCIETTASDLWTEDNLLLCVTICLQLLHQCIITNRCPHYFIPGNNLLEGRIDGRIRKKLAHSVNHILSCNGDFILELKIDDIGDRLNEKLCPLVYGGINFLQKEQMLYKICSKSCRDLFQWLFMCVSNIATTCINDVQIVTKMMSMLNLYRNGTPTERKAAELMTPSLCTTIASCLASNSIQHRQELSNQALSFFAMGIDSDVSSGRLKLASALYCSGDMERTEMILRAVKERYNPGEIEPLCDCISTEFKASNCRLSVDIIHNVNVSDLRFCFAFGVMFTRGEIHCVPPALRYEMFRCTEEEIARKDEFRDKWMDCAVVDSLPYLYYLQYLTYGRLGRQREQQIALDGLIASIHDEPELFHRETAMNLLGQCMEQESRLWDALDFYRCSLDERPTHNVARWHVVDVLMKLYNDA